MKHTFDAARGVPPEALEDLSLRHAGVGSHAGGEARAQLRVVRGVDGAADQAAALGHKVAAVVVEARAVAEGRHVLLDPLALRLRDLPWRRRSARCRGVTATSGPIRLHVTFHRLAAALALARGLGVDRRSVTGAPARDQHVRPSGPEARGVLVGNVAPLVIVNDTNGERAAVEGLRRRQGSPSPSRDPAPPPLPPSSSSRRGNPQRSGRHHRRRRRRRLRPTRGTTARLRGAPGVPRRRRPPRRARAAPTGRAHPPPRAILQRCRRLRRARPPIERRVRATAIWAQLVTRCEVGDCVVFRPAKCLRQQEPHWRLRPRRRRELGGLPSSRSQRR